VLIKSRAKDGKNGVNEIQNAVKSEMIWAGKQRESAVIKMKKAGNDLSEALGVQLTGEQEKEAERSRKSAKSSLDASSKALGMASGAKVGAENEEEEAEKTIQKVRAEEEKDRVEKNKEAVNIEMIEADKWRVNAERKKLQANNDLAKADAAERRDEAAGWQERVGTEMVNADASKKTAELRRGSANRDLLKAKIKEFYNVIIGHMTEILKRMPSVKPEDLGLLELGSKVMPRETESEIQNAAGIQGSQLLLELSSSKDEENAVTQAGKKLDDLRTKIEVNLVTKIQQEMENALNKVTEQMKKNTAGNQDPDWWENTAEKREKEKLTLTSEAEELVGEAKAIVSELQAHLAFLRVSKVKQDALKEHDFAEEKRTQAKGMLIKSRAKDGKNGVNDIQNAVKSEMVFAQMWRKIAVEKMGKAESDLNGANNDLKANEREEERKRQLSEVERAAKSAREAYSNMTFLEHYNRKR
jgi:hypothetical protein